MRNMTICVSLVLFCTIVFTGQSADTPQKDAPSLRDLLGVDIPDQPVSEKQKPNFSVAVFVECEDENTKAFIESHIKRELRSLQDVEIVGIGIGGGYKLSIVAIEMRSSGRKNGSIAVSYVFTKTFDPLPLQEKIEKLVTDHFPLQLDAEVIVLQLDAEVTGLMFLHEDPRHLLQVGMTDDLDRICKEIVVDFDTQMLEPNRR